MFSVLLCVEVFVVFVILKIFSCLNDVCLSELLNKWACGVILHEVKFIVFVVW